ncbi:MAG TPA: hypothetical protein VFG58_08165 [Solirubrobacterales bacterium]|nr:hypothetical protein [Solirubrobacterales bacterium]
MTEHGAQAETKTGFRLKTRVDRCPDASGEEPGDGLLELDLSVSGATPGMRVSKPGSRLQATARPKLESKLLARVDGNGRVEDFDVRLHGTFYVAGGIASGKPGHETLTTTDPPQLYVADVDLLGIDPHDFGKVKEGRKPTLDSIGKLKVRRILGPANADVKNASRFGRVVAGALGMEAALGSVEYLEAEEGWNGGKPCVNVTPSASATALKPGQSVPVSVTIAGPAKKGTAPGRFTAAVDRGNVSPGQGSYEGGKQIHLTYTAPSTAPEANPILSIHTVSAQGKASGRIEFHVSEPTYKLLYTHTTGGSDAYEYDNSYPPYLVDEGSWQEHRDVQVSASVPLTPGPGGTLSGSGSVHWTRSSWSSDDDNTGTNNAGGTCENEDREQLTGAGAGALRVNSLSLGASPSADVVLSDLRETWRQNDVPKSGGSEECPGNVQDYPRSELLTEIDLAHSDSGDVVGTTSDESEGCFCMSSVELRVDSGWQAGSGEVAATRTLEGTTPYALGPEGPEGTTITYRDTFEILRSEG